MSLTQKRLHELLYYDPEAGYFMWMKRRGRAGGKTEAGSKHSGGYMSIMVDGVNYLAHRLAWMYMTGDWPEFEIDHEDRIKTHNRWRNLRPATHKQNMENSTVRKSSKSGVKGVHFIAQSGRWQAYLTHNYKRYHGGRHPTLKLAIAARTQLERQFFTHAPK